MASVTRVLRRSSRPSSATGHRTGSHEEARYATNRPFRPSSAAGHRTRTHEESRSAYNKTKQHDQPFSIGYDETQEPGWVILGGQDHQPREADRYQTSDRFNVPQSHVSGHVEGHDDTGRHARPPSQQSKRGHTVPVPRSSPYAESSSYPDPQSMKVEKPTTTKNDSKRFQLMANVTSKLSSVTSQGPKHAQNDNSRVAQLVTENDGLREHVNSQGRQIQTMSHQAQVDGGELHNLRERYESTKVLLDARTRELEVAQQFLTTADNIAEADVIRMVEKLNNDILQLASSLAESLPHSNRRRANRYGSTADKSSRDIDPAIQNLLRDSRISGHDPSLAVQIAIQAYFVSSCSRTIRSWHPNEGHNEVFESLYEELQRRVSPQIAGKWRTLTKSCLFQIPTEERKPVSQTVAEMFKSDLSKLLKIAGYEFDLHRIWTKDFLTSLRLLAESALELRRSIGEELSASELAVLFYRSGGQFDPRAMEDNFTRQSSRGKISLGTVLCTTDLGVERLQTRNGEKERHVLLKCKVALEDVRREALNPGS